MTWILRLKVFSTCQARRIKTNARPDISYEHQGWGEKSHVGSLCLVCLPVLFWMHSPRSLSLATASKLLRMDSVMNHPEPPGKNTPPAAENCAGRQPSATTLLTLHRLWSHLAQNHAPFWGSPLSMTSQQKYKPDTSSQSRMTVKGSSPWGLRYDCITAQLLPLLPASFPSLPQTVIPKGFPN